MSAFKVAIIGAGPAGCMLARLLHVENIDVAVFEGESAPDYRSQGGSLDLHTHTGLAAMKAAGLWDQFLEHARYDGEYMAVVDKDLHYYVRRGMRDQSTALDRESPEIDRSRLRQILTESLPEGMIKWGHHLKRVEPDRTLVFEHASISGFDLIVGADGAWSKVRALLAPENHLPHYIGVGIHELAIPDAAHTAPRVSRLVNRGSVFAYADGKKLVLQQMGDGSINVCACAATPDADWMDPAKCGYDAHDQAATIAALREEWAEFSPELTDAFALATSGKCVPRSLYALPVGFRWAHRAGATCVGDAAHLMGPFAGEGVNVALEDAMKLASGIVEAARGDGSAALLDRKVEEFEREMFPRAERYQQLTDDLMRIWMFTPNAPKASLAPAMARLIKFKAPRVLHPLASALAHTYVALHKVEQPSLEVEPAR